MGMSQGICNTCQDSERSGGEMDKEEVEGQGRERIK